MPLVDATISVGRKLQRALVPQHVVFHHVPKCAGSSVSRALRMRYLLSQESISAGASVDAVECDEESPDGDARQQELRKFRRQLLHYYLSKDVSFVGGHVQFNLGLFSKFKSRYRFITVLRHPVDRFISEYFFNLNREHHAKVTLPIGEYLETRTAFLNARKLCEYFCGHDVYDPQSLDENVADSIRNLSCFDVIGFTDRMDEFRRGLSQTLGVSVSFGRARAGTASKAEIEKVITPEVRARIKALCEADTAVYDAARAIWCGRPRTA